MIRQFIEAYLCSPIYREVAEALRRDGWVFDENTANHESGLHLWTGNGWPFLNVHPAGAAQGLRLLDRWMLRRWVHLARAREIRHGRLKWESPAAAPPKPRDPADELWRDAK